MFRLCCTCHDAPNSCTFLELYHRGILFYLLSKDRTLLLLQTSILGFWPSSFGCLPIFAYLVAPSLPWSVYASPVDRGDLSLAISTSLLSSILFIHSSQSVLR